MIYLDNAATTLRKPDGVIEAVADAMRSYGNAARGVHESTLRASRRIYETRKKLAQLFNCPSPSRVIFTCNATEALNIAIDGVIEEGDHVISTDLEHNSVLRPLYHLEEEKNVSLTFIKADRQGCVDYEDFERSINDRTKAIVCTHASNLTGNALDIRRIGTIAKAHGLFFIVDASQTAGVLGVDMQEMHIDLLCMAGHKGLMGPQGTGVLCINEGIEVKPFKRGGTGVQTYKKDQPEEYPTRLEAGTLNSHGIAGLSAALDYIMDQGVDKIASKEYVLMMRFFEGVKEIEGVKIYGDFSTDYRTAVVTLNVRDYESGEVSDFLYEEFGIATRPGAHCAPRMHQALGTVEQGAVRFSFSCFNTEEEVDRAVEAIRSCAAEE